MQVLHFDEIFWHIFWNKSQLPIAAIDWQTLAKTLILTISVQVRNRLVTYFSIDFESKFYKPRYNSILLSNTSLIGIIFKGRKETNKLPYPSRLNIRHSIVGLFLFMWMIFVSLKLAVKSACSLIIPRYIIRQDCQMNPFMGMRKDLIII